MRTGLHPLPYPHSLRSHTRPRWSRRYDHLDLPSTLRATVARSSLAQRFCALGRLPLLGRAHRNAHNFTNPDPTRERRDRCAKRQRDRHGAAPFLLCGVRKSALVDGARLDRRATPWREAFVVQRIAGAPPAPRSVRASSADDCFLTRRRRS